MASTAERYEEALTQAARRHFAAHVAELAAEDDVVDLADEVGSADMWQLAVEAAEAELAERERAAVAEVQEERISRAYARMYA